MFFSWEDIKDTWTYKVTCGADIIDQACGVLEVAGKSVVAVTTETAQVVVNAVKDGSLSEKIQEQVERKNKQK